MSRRATELLRRAGRPLGALGLHGERGGGAGAVGVAAVDVGGHGQRADALAEARLLHHLLGARRVAAADGVVAADARGVSVAREHHLLDELLGRARQRRPGPEVVGVRLRRDLAVLALPRHDVRRVPLRDEGADVVALHRQDHDRVRPPELLLEQHQHVVLLPQEGPGHVVKLLRWPAEGVLVGDPVAADALAVDEHHALAHRAHVQHDRVLSRRHVEVPLVPGERPVVHGRLPGDAAHALVGVDLLPLADEADDVAPAVIRQVQRARVQARDLHPVHAGQTVLHVSATVRHSHRRCQDGDVVHALLQVHGLLERERLVHLGPVPTSYEFVVDKRHAGMPMAVDLEHCLDVAADRHVVRLQLEAGGVPDVVGLVLGEVVEVAGLAQPDLGLLVLGHILPVEHLPHVVLRRLVREVERPLVVLRVHVLGAEDDGLAVGEDADGVARHEVGPAPERHRRVVLGVVVGEERHAHLLLRHLEHPRLQLLAQLLRRRRPPQQGLLAQLQRLVQVPQMAPLGLLVQAEFVERCLVVVFWHHKGSRCPSEVCSTMVHVIVCQGSAHGEEARHGECNVLSRTLGWRVTEYSVLCCPVLSPQERHALVRWTWPCISTVSPIAGRNHITRSFGLLAHDPRYADVGGDGHLRCPVDVLGALIFERRFHMLVLVLDLC
uniref:Uncharacterized protein n=1 Tax=Zea mays TaxID=4577 RepID=C0PDV2_MAIZE|nr:unknown [Zea mays]